MNIKAYNNEEKWLVTLVTELFITESLLKTNSFLLFA